MNTISLKQLIKVENSFLGDLYYKIDCGSSGRRLVIPDIHGCSHSFNELLNQINLNKDDNLFLLGDYINRGKRNKEVIEKIIYLIENDYKIFPLRGNHEQRLLEKHKKNYTEEELKLPKQFKAKDLLDDNYKIRNQYLGLISNLPYYYDIGDYFLVHAGLNFSAENIYEDYHSMIWIKEMKFDKTKINKTMIVGHVAHDFLHIKNEIENNENIIHLDNGCVYKSNSKLGNLLCLDIDSKQLYVQENIDLI